VARVLVEKVTVEPLPVRSGGPLTKGSSTILFAGRIVIDWDNDTEHILCTGLRPGSQGDSAECSVSLATPAIGGFGLDSKSSGCGHRMLA